MGSRPARPRGGAPGPFAQHRAAKEPEKKGPDDRILHVSSFRDPVREIDKLTELYESLAEARREVGESGAAVPQVRGPREEPGEKLRQSGTPEVAFRVAVKDGKVSFTARALKGAGDDD